MQRPNVSPSPLPVKLTNPHKDKPCLSVCLLVTYEGGVIKRSSRKLP